MKPSEILAQIEPTVRRWMIDYTSNITSPGVVSGDYAPYIHELGGSNHAGTLNDDQAPQFLMVDGSRQLTGNLGVDVGITIDGVDISALAASFTTHLSQDAVTGHGSVGAHDHLTASAGGQLDHGAALTGLGDDDHTQYAGADAGGITRSAYQAERLNKQTIAGVGLTGGGTHTTDITLNVGAGTGIQANADNVAIDLAATLTWTGQHTFQALLTARDLLPEATDSYDIGSSLKLWRKGYFTQLEALIFAENTIFPIGGWFVICKYQGNIEDATGINTTQTTVNLGVVGPTVNDFIVMRSLGQTEYMQITADNGGGSFNVTRGLNNGGTGFAWPKGAVWADYGYGATAGAGRIEWNANDTPRVSFIKQGNTYNTQTELIRIGDLNGLGGFSAETYGAFFGEYASGKPNLYVTPTEFKLRNYTTDIITLDSTGAFIQGNLTLDNGALVIDPGFYYDAPAAKINGVGMQCFVGLEEGFDAEPTPTYTPQSSYRFTFWDEPVNTEEDMGGIYGFVFRHETGSYAKSILVLEPKSVGPSPIIGIGSAVASSTRVHVIAGDMWVEAVTRLRSTLFVQGATTLNGNLSMAGGTSAGLGALTTPSLNGWLFQGAGTSLPSSPATGWTYFLTNFRAMFYYDGSAWKQVSTGSFASSFPASPVDNLRVYREDKDETYFYNSATSKWLSQTIYPCHLIEQTILPGLHDATNIGTTDTVLFNLGIDADDQDVYVFGMANLYVVTTNNASNYYQVTIEVIQNDAGGTATTLLSSHSTAGYTANTSNPVSLTAGIFAAVAQNAVVRVKARRTLTPGRLSCRPNVSYRKVLT